MLLLCWDFWEGESIVTKKNGILTEKLANNEKELKEIKDSKQYINSDKNLGNDLNKYLKENTELKNENNKLKEDMG